MKYFLYITCLCLFISCNNSRNTQEFMSISKGKYLFNSNESIEVYFKDDILKLTWRGKNLTGINIKTLEEFANLLYNNYPGLEDP